MVNATQYIEVLPLPPGQGINRLDHTAYNTSSAEGMRKYLAAKGWKTPEKVMHGSDGSRWFEVLDPEGNKVEFVQPPANSKAPDEPNAIGHQIIHIGMLVHDRAKEDTFYRDLLDFKPYWYGGMQEGKIDWVSQQVPNGHEWLEYMLTSGPSGSGIPANISQHQLGVLDHFSIGEVSVPAAYKELAAGNRLGGVHDQATQDRQRRQIPVQPLRPRRHSDGVDELPRHGEALLLAFHSRRSVARPGNHKSR